MRTHSLTLLVSSLFLSGLLGLGCSDGTSPPSGGTGGKTPATGGSATGGTTPVTGGISATGGNSAPGGVVSTGGLLNTGGTKATGGLPQTTGGVSGPGGVVATGGVADPGGAKATGGSAPAGGAAGSGGRPGCDGGMAGTPGTGGSGTGGNSSPGVDGGTPSAGKSAGCGKAPTLTASQYNNGNPIAITAASKARRYILSVPTTYDNTKPYKLVIAIHQLDGNDKQMYSQKYYGLQSLSSDTTIFVAPNGQKNGAPCTGTSVAESGCGWPNGSGADMALMDAVVAQVEENFCIDTNRIFATGWSYGASMSYETGCQRALGGTTGGVAGYIRAIAIYSGAQMSGSCKPSTPIGFYGSHGTNDNVLGYDGGVKLAQNFATANGCTWSTPTKATGAHICTNVTGCKAGSPTEFCSFVGPHTPFPDSGAQASTWQPPVVWDFFKQF